MINVIKLQVPMDKDVRDALAKKASSYGFDSVQAYIRFWAKAEADNRRVNLEVDDWGEPSHEAAARLNKIADDARRGINVSEPFDSVEAMMEHLNNLEEHSDVEEIRQGVQKADCPDQEAQPAVLRTS